MKKILSIFIAFLTLSASSLFALGSDVLATPTDKDDWNVAFKLYARTVGQVGRGLNKDDGGTGYSGSLRIRPGMIATNGSFTFGTTLTTDINYGTGGINGGANGNRGFGLGAHNSNYFGIISLYMGYKWDNGIYTVWGIQDAYLPYLNGDEAAGTTMGWKNDIVDVTAFYFLFTKPDIRSIKGDTGFFGVKATITPTNGFSITPYIAALYQGSNVGLKIFDDGSGNLFPSQNHDSMGNYGANGAFFAGNIGMYAGLGMNYTMPFGLYINLNAVYAYGKNKTVNVDQTRNAFGGLLSVGYTLEEIMTAEIFFDFRSGSKNIDTDGTNASINGALIEYDATVAPLYILYNASLSRAGYGYTNNFKDGYAFSDRGAITVGADATFSLGMFDLGFALGYAWYSATPTGGDANLGFEADLTAVYKIMNGLSMVIEAGVLIPGEGLKNTVGTRDQMPWVTNVIFKYSL